MNELYLPPIRKKTISILPTGKRKKWTQQELDKLTKLYPDISNIELAVIFGVTKSSIAAQSNILGLLKSELFMLNPENRNFFKKGSIPFNKGKKGLSFGGVKTQFKKGNMPLNTKHDGTITIRISKGIKYKYIRIAKSKWIPLQRYNYEKKHGQIPIKMFLVCKTKNTLNCNLNNWMLITRSENLNRNRNYKKMSNTMRELWKSEKIRKKYGFERKTKLQIK